MDEALELIEYYCKRTFTSFKYTEEINLVSRIGHLTVKPALSIEEIYVQSTSWLHSNVFGSTDWIKLDLSTVDFDGDKFMVPLSLMNEEYTKAKVTYKVPREMPKELVPIYQLLTETIVKAKPKTKYQLHSLISPEIAKMLDPYRV